MLAVIISGSLRNFEETWPKNLELIKNIGEPFRIYLHTWSTNFGTPRKVYKDVNWNGLVLNPIPKVYQQSQIDVSMELLRNYLPEATILIEEFDEQAMVAEFSIPSEYISNLHRNFINTVGMYKGMATAFRKALADAQKYGIDKFLRLRTDFQFFETINAEGNRSQIYFMGPGVDPGFGYVSDQCFLVDSTVAHTIANIDEILKLNVTNFGWGHETLQPFYGERVLSFALKDIRHSLVVQRGPILGRIVRPQIKLDLEADKFDYFLEISRHNFYVIRQKLLFFMSKIVNIFRRSSI